MIAGLPKVPANAFIQLGTKAFFVFLSSLETFATPLFAQPPVEDAAYGEADKSLRPR
jgi:hypothetical protein